MRLLYARHVLPAIETASPLDLGRLILVRVFRLDPDFDRLVILQSARCNHATGGMASGSDDHIHVAFQLL